MNISVQYSIRSYLLEFDILDGDVVIIKTKGAKHILSYCDKIFISGFGKQISNVVEDDLFLSRNILCFDLNGNFLWQIHPCDNAKNRIKLGGTNSARWQFIDMYVKNNIVYAYNDDMLAYEVNLDTGDVKRSCYVK